MTQTAKPDGDVSDGDWVNNITENNTDLYSYIDLSGGGIRNISSEDTASAASTCEVSLDNNITGDVAESNLDVVIRAHAIDDAEAGVLDLTVQLMEGSTSRATWTIDDLDTDTAGVVVFTLSVFGTDTRRVSTNGTITSYDDLRLRFTRAAGTSFDGQTVVITWAIFNAPDEVVASTASSALSGLSALSGIQT